MRPSNGRALVLTSGSIGCAVKERLGRTLPIGMSTSGEGADVSALCRLRRTWESSFLRSADETPRLVGHDRIDFNVIDLDSESGRLRSLGRGGRLATSSLSGGQTRHRLAGRRSVWSLRNSPSMGNTRPCAACKRRRNGALATFIPDYTLPGALRPAYPLYFCGCPRSGRGTR